MAAGSESKGSFTSDDNQSEGDHIFNVRRKILEMQIDGGTAPLDRLDHLWVFLPSEINHEIILRVPLDDLMRWRRVCKKWNILITSGHDIPKAFTRNLALVVHSDRRLTVASISAYNEKAEQWCTIDLDFLITILCRKDMLLQDCRYITGGRLGLLFLLCSFHSGLDLETEVSVVVCNPLTKKYKHVKIPDERRGGYVRVISDGEQKHYKLLVSYKDDHHHNLYDSTLGSWKKVSGPRLDPYYIFSAITTNGCLYFLQRPGILEMPRPPTMYRYDPVCNTWSEILALPTHVGPDLPRLVETEGEILYIARSYILEKKVGRLSWCFYKMGNSESRAATGTNPWVKVREMPKDLYRKLNLSVITSPIYREIRCVGQGQYIYFVGIECTCVHLNKRFSNQGVILFVVAHDFQRNTWTWLPDHVDPEARYWPWESNSIRLMSFQPSLTTV